MHAYDRIKKALDLNGFDNYRPAVDVPNLHRPRTRPETLPGDGRVAAVLILVYAASENASFEESKLVLTKRQATLSKHASQISFPGGRQDDGESLKETALRETEEEIGVPRSRIEIVGQLNPVYIPPTDFTVTPFVGWHPLQPHFVRSEDEVEQIIEAPLSQLVDPNTLVFEDVESQTEGTIKVPLYRLGPHQVWGATAIMLGELIERIRLSL